MPRIAGQLVTDADCNGVFQPKGGYIPTNNNTLILDGNTIFARYNVTIAGGQSTRCPSWDQITSNIIVFTHNLAKADCVHYVSTNKTPYYSTHQFIIISTKLYKDVNLTILADFGDYTDDTREYDVDSSGTVWAIQDCPKVTLNWEVSVFDTPAMTDERFYIEHFGVKVVDTTVSASGSIVLPANAPLFFSVRGDPAYLYILVRSGSGSTIYTNEGDVGLITQSLTFTTGQSPIDIDVTISGF